jgi:hypothetical protein
MLDLEDMFKKAQEFLDSDDGKKFTDDFVNKQKINDFHENRRVQLIHKKFGSDIDSFIEKVETKYDSDEYKDRWYLRSIQPEEMLYWCLYDYAKFLNRRASIELIDEYGSEMFGGNEAYIVGSYFFQLISGQGAAIIVRKINYAKNK